MEKLTLQDGAVVDARVTQVESADPGAVVLRIEVWFSAPRDPDATPADTIMYHTLPLGMLAEGAVTVEAVTGEMRKTAAAHALNTKKARAALAAIPKAKPNPV